MARAILVVDDSPTIRQQLGIVLEHGGYEVADADGGTAGLACARSRAFDLIITDVNMPEGDGLTMVSEIRKLEGYAKTPVFVLTTESKRDMVAKGGQVGATAWIVKPFNPEALCRAIAKVLGP
jgi:two-component system chemotaxis response regulator CheY